MSGFYTFHQDVPDAEGDSPINHLTSSSHLFPFEFRTLQQIMLLLEEDVFQLQSPQCLRIAFY